MTKPYEVTMNDQHVVVYTYGPHSSVMKRVELTPFEAREFARELIIHADDVDDIATDAREQMQG